jgi:hypothetical protein
MGGEWRIYSGLSSQEAAAIEERYAAALEAYLDEHPDAEGGSRLAEVLASGLVPATEEILSALDLAPQDLAPAVRERLENCRSVLILDRPGNLELDRLQVSALRYLLEQAAPCLLGGGEDRLELGEKVISGLRRYRSSGPLEGKPEPPAPPRPVRRRAERPGEVRALRMLATLRALEDDPLLAEQARGRIRAVPELGRRYLRHLMEDGPANDTEVAKALGVPRPELELAADELDRLLIDLAGDYPEPR